jgi:hypothetical protein
MRRIVLSLALILLAALLATRCVPVDVPTTGRSVAGQMTRITFVHSGEAAGVVP